MGTSMSCPQAQQSTDVSFVELLAAADHHFPRGAILVHIRQEPSVIFVSVMILYVIASAYCNFELSHWSGDNATLKRRSLVDQSTSRVVISSQHAYQRWLHAIP